MREHLVECIFPRPLAERRVNRDVAAKNRLDARPDVTDDRARPHHNAPHHAEAFDRAIAGQFKRRCRQRMGLTHNAGIQHHSAAGMKPILQMRIAPAGSEACWAAGFSPLAHADQDHAQGDEGNADPGAQAQALAQCDAGHQAWTTRRVSPLTVFHAAPGTRCVSASTSSMAFRNQSMSSRVMMSGGRNLMNSV